MVPILLGRGVMTTVEPELTTDRRLPIGVEVHDRELASARVWAPLRKTVELVVYGKEGRITRATALEPEQNGYFAARIEGLSVGSQYRFRLDSGDAFPDPASRFQPAGPHGPSEVIDPSAFDWTDQEWPGLKLAGQVITEVHIGTFTPEGTFKAAIAKLDALVDVGITAVEIMPVADFAGSFGWGYDGVNLYAPNRLYGTPDDFRGFVNAAHARGLGVILDVVYNHLGPDGNYLGQYSDSYTAKRETEWGDALNFDGEHSGPVREFFVENAGYWISEFHVDGLRLDATQQIFDGSSRHIIADVVTRARAAAHPRDVVIIA
jgi:maltooligosyltrehalose trehalohydrolase